MRQEIHARYSNEMHMAKDKRDESFETVIQIYHDTPDIFIAILKTGKQTQEFSHLPKIL